MENTAINKARIVYYCLFSSLFSFNMTEDEFQKVVQAVEVLSENPMDEQSNKAMSNMKRRLQKSNLAKLSKENHDIFYNPTSASVPMTASFFDEGRDDGQKRVEMIDYVQESKFRRNAESYKEHEDHIEFILQFIQKLIEEELRGDTKANELAMKVYKNILNPMIDQFIDKLIGHRQSFFYKQAALALSSFNEFERLYLDIPQPEIPGDGIIIQRERLPKKEPAKGCVNLDAGQCV